MTDDDYYTIRTGGPAGEGAHRPRPLRTAAAFVAAALAVTVVAVPFARDRLERFELAQRPANLDTRAVGSIGGPIGERPRGRGAPRDGTKRYVVRRSVLSEGGPCIIRGNSGRSGNC